jgi:cytochrome c-type biogenesis protein CcmH
MNPDVSPVDALKQKIFQLKELHESGALSTPLFEDNRAALERQLLDCVLGSNADAAGVPILSSRPAVAAQATPAAPVPRVQAAERLSPGLMAVLAVVVLGVAGAGYWWMGSPSRVGVEPAGVAAAGDGQNAQASGGAASHLTTAEQIEAMTEKLTARLKAQPDDAEGWSMLARSYTVLGRHPEALPAYERAVALRADDAQLLADYADSLAVKNKRVLAGEPMKWVDKALKIDPRNVKALALAGTNAFDRKDYAGAVKYWDQVVQFGPADSNYVQQVQASLAEARELGGLPPASVRPATIAAAPPAPSVPTPAQPAVSLSNKQVSGTVSLAPSLVSQASPEDTLFVFARGPEGKGMPLAILRKKVKDLPLQFTLDDSMAMSPAAKISGVASVVVSARISKTGEAFPQAGDLSGQTGPVNLGAASLRVEIRDVVKP